jgi:hypothetical protein
MPGAGTASSIVFFMSSLRYWTIDWPVFVDKKQYTEHWAWAWWIPMPRRRPKKLGRIFHKRISRAGSWAILDCEKNENHKSCSRDDTGGCYFLLLDRKQIHLEKLFILVIDLVHDSIPPNSLQPFQTNGVGILSFPTTLALHNGSKILAGKF